MTDPKAIDVLVLKDRQDYQETMNCWKQIDHVMGILLEPRQRPQRTFLQKFYEGAFVLAVTYNCIPKALPIPQVETRKPLFPPLPVFRNI